MATKGEFMTVLKRLDYQSSDSERAAYMQQAGRLWLALSSVQRDALVRDDFRCRLFAAGYAAGRSAVHAEEAKG